MDLRQLALQAANQLERKRTGKSYDRAAVDKLAAALRAAADGTLIEPLYFGPFSRLFNVQRDQELNSLDQLQQFLLENSEKLSELLAGQKDGSDATLGLIQFCVALHKELIAEAEDALGYNERRSSQHLSAARVRAA